MGSWKAFLHVLIMTWILRFASAAKGMLPNEGDSLVVFASNVTALVPLSALLVSTDIPAKKALLSSASVAMGRVRNEGLQTSVVFASNFVRAPVPPSAVSVPTYIGKDAPLKKGGRRLMNSITDGRGSVTRTISTDLPAKKALLSSASVAMGRVRNEGLQTSVVFASNFVRAPVPPSTVSIPTYIGKNAPPKKGGRRLMNSITDGRGSVTRTISTDLPAMKALLSSASVAMGRVRNEGLQTSVVFASNFVRAPVPPSAVSIPTYIGKNAPPKKGGRRLMNSITDGRGSVTHTISTDLPAKNVFLSSASVAMGKVRNEGLQTSVVFASNFVRAPVPPSAVSIPTYIGKNAPQKKGGRRLMNSITDGRGSVTRTISTDLPAKKALLSSASVAMGRVRNEGLQTSVVFASNFVRAPVPPSAVSIPTYIGKNAPPKKGGRRLMNSVTDGRGSVTRTISTDLPAMKALLSSASVAMGRVRNEGLQTSVVFASNFVRAPVPPSAVSIPTYIGKNAPPKKGGRHLMNSITDGRGSVTHTISTDLPAKNAFLSSASVAMGKVRNEGLQTSVVFASNFVRAPVPPSAVSIPTYIGKNAPLKKGGKHLMNSIIDGRGSVTHTISTDLPAKKACLSLVSVAMERVRNEGLQTSVVFASNFVKAPVPPSTVSIPTNIGKNAPPKKGGRRLMNSITDGRGSVTHTISTDSQAKKALLSSASVAMGRVRNGGLQTSVVFASNFVRAPVPPSAVSIPTYIGKNAPPKKGGRRLMNSITDGRGSVTHTISTDSQAKKALLSSASVAMGRVRNGGLQTSVVFASNFVRAPVPPSAVSIPTYIGKNAPPKKGGRRLMNSITDGRGSVIHTISTDLPAKKALLSSVSVAMERVRNEGLQTSVVFASNFARAPVPPSAVSIPTYIGKNAPPKKGG